MAALEPRDKTFHALTEFGACSLARAIASQNSGAGKEASACAPHREGHQRRAELRWLAKPPTGRKKAEKGPADRQQNLRVNPLSTLSEEVHTRYQGPGTNWRRELRV